MLEYEKTVLVEYTGNKDGKNVFHDPTNFKLKESFEKLKSANQTPSVEFIYEWIKQESREIEVRTNFNE